MDEIKFKLDSRTNLVVHKNSDYNEFNIYVEKGDVVLQDLAVVRQKYYFDDNGEIIHVPGEYEVLVWANENDEDYTDKFQIKEYVNKD